MTKTAKPRFRIVWAVDASGERADRAADAAARALRALGRRTGAEIEPVYVLSLAGSGGMTYGMPWVQPYLSRAEERLRAIARTSGVPARLAPRVILTGGDSAAVCVRSLARHARESGAGLIVVGSHARRSVSRLFLGSFAESLMLWTPAPLLVVSPEAVTSRPFKRVLFPTDFSGASRRAFRGLLKLAARLQARVVVLHVVRPPLPGEPERGRLGAAERAAALVAEARRSGVAAAAVIRDQRDDSVSETILEEARRSGVALIAMAAQSRGWSATFVGSDSRQVVRGARCPVLILRGPLSASAGRALKA